MDASNKYFLMCKKATEIQKVWQFENGDLFTTMAQVERDIKPAIVDRVIWKDFLEKNKRPPLWIWLPRQGQLQEMVIKYGKDIKPEWFPCLLYVVDFFLKPYAIECERSTGYPFPDTMEQMWLSFVMKDKYNKVWTGKIWKKIKDT